MELKSQYHFLRQDPLIDSTMAEFAGDAIINDTTLIREILARLILAF